MDLINYQALAGIAVIIPSVCICHYMSIEHTTSNTFI